MKRADFAAVVFPGLTFAPWPLSNLPAAAWPFIAAFAARFSALALARFFNNIVEPRVIDGAVDGVANFFLMEAREFRLIQTGRVSSYALWTLGGAIGVVLVVAAFLGYLPVRLGG